jgi:hypothetical protein
MQYLCGIVCESLYKVLIWIRCKDGLKYVKREKKIVIDPEPDNEDKQGILQSFFAGKFNNFVRKFRWAIFGITITWNVIALISAS